MKSTTFFERMNKLGQKDSLRFEREAFYVPSDIKRTGSYIRSIKSQYPDCSIQEFEDILLKDYYENLSPNVLAANYAFEHYMDILSIKKLREDGKLFDQIYEKVSAPDFKPSDTPSTFEEYLSTYVYSSIYQNRNQILIDSSSLFSTEELIIANDSSLSPEEKFNKLSTHIKKTVVKKIDQQELLKYAKIVSFGFKHYLPIDEASLKKLISKDLKQSIVSMVTGLKSIGAYSKYEKINGRNFAQLGFPEFNTNQSTNESMYVDVTKNPNILDTVSIDDLMVLNSFWLNRYNKELKVYSTCLSVIKEKGILQEVLDNKIDEDKLCFKETRPCIEKGQTLFPVINAYVQKVQKSIFEDNVVEGTLKKEPSTLNTDSECIVQLSYEPLKELMHKGNFNVEYKKHFDELIPTSKNDASNDIEFYATLYNPSILAYMEKSNYLAALVSNMIANKALVNAGILPQKYIDKSHIELPQFIGIGIDSNLTFPVREHLSTNFLKNFVKSFTGSSIVPIYEGNNDFNFPFNPEKMASAQLVLPFSRKQIDLLKQTVKNKEHNNPNFVEHLHFLANPKKLPQSFRLTTKKSTSSKEKAIFQRKFADLEDGQIYTLDKTGYVKYVPEIKNNNDNKKDVDNKDEER